MTDKTNSITPTDGGRDPYASAPDTNPETNATGDTEPATPPNGGCANCGDVDCRGFDLGYFDAYEWFEHPDTDRIERCNVGLWADAYLTGETTDLPPMPQTLRARFHSRPADGEIHLTGEDCWTVGVGVGLLSIVEELLPAVDEAMKADSHQTLLPQEPTND